MGPFHVAIAAIAMVTILGVLGMLTDAVKGGKAKADAGYSPEESKLMQDLHRIATRLEERVEILETILIERANRPEGERAHHD
jgi:phage shock protein B